MTFKEAFEAMKHGAKVKLPSWAGIGSGAFRHSQF